ncbi:MAG: DUF4376 domain-containing protein [Campylobacteraceae bacterium]|jgi:hypothetical protein|nr:DUF4376 domain-containing protein [Campylobacteraceae bacterium]
MLYAVKNILGQVSLLEADVDYIKQEGYVKINSMADLPDTDSELWDIVDGKLIVKTTPEIPLEELKAQKKAEINAKKEAAEHADITYLNNVYQADADSQNKLTSAVLLCQAAGLTTYDWWTADNKRVTLSVAEIVGLGVTIAQRSSALVAKGREKKDAIDKANKAALEKIKWE